MIGITRRNFTHTILGRTLAAIGLVLLSRLFVSRAPAQTFTVLHAFQGGHDGYGAYGGVVQDRQGNLYGTTIGGGRYRNGVIFKINAAGEEKILHSFFHSEGAQPEDSLLLDAAGNLYGTADLGGIGGGTVFELLKGGKLKVLHRFLQNVEDD